MSQFFRWLFRASCDEVRHIAHLPFVERITHAKARRSIMAVAVGVLLMLVGSAIASSAETLSRSADVPPIVVDTFGYFRHAIGAVPALRHIEPLCLVIVVAAELLLSHF